MLKFGGSENLNKVERKQEGIPWIKLVINIICAYVVTLIMLLILAFLLYKMNISEKTISGGIIITYILSCFAAGFLAGRQMKQKRFLWGLIMGMAYYIILLVLSIAMNQTLDTMHNSVFTTLLLCAGGGMMGGMLS